MTARRPDFVIIGAQKAGSSLLHNSLRGHPDVWLRADEDPYFRDPVYRAADLPAFERAYSGRSESRVGMKCPDYLARREVPHRLRTHLGDPDLVLALRNPVGRAVSAYFWWMRWGMLPLRPPEEGLRDLLDLARRGSDEPAVQVLEWGLYGRHLARYREHFRPEKMFVITDDELRGDPAAAVSGVYAFLGVRPDVAPPTAATDDNPGVYAMERLRFLQLRNRYILQWDEERTFPSIPRPRGGWPRAYSDAVAGVDRYLLARFYDNERPTLSDDLSGELHAYYRDDVALLESLTGRDLARWRGRAPAAGGA